MKDINVAVFGHSGYAGQELTGILEKHPNVQRIQTFGRDSPDDLSGIDTAFLALPHGVSGQLAKHLRAADSTVIDLSGDFRFKTAEEYKTWYRQEQPAPDLLPAPYGLPEVNRGELKGNKLIAVPGCYPTATLLGILPLIKAGLVEPDSQIIVDAISGISGMGRAKAEQRMADEMIGMTGDVMPYSTGRVHRHVGEMEQFLEGREIFFSPAVGSYFRGLLSKITVLLTSDTDEQAVNDSLQEAYADEELVEVRPPGEVPCVANTANTSECHIGAVVAGSTVQVVSSLDNLRKGAASQAVQVFNVLNELPEASGLYHPHLGVERKKQ